jgi:hypothetical protein
VNIATGLTLVTCDGEEGGCERQFVIDVKAELHVKSLKVEGQELSE